MITFLHIQPTFNSTMHFFCDNSKIFTIHSNGSLQEEIDLKVIDGKNFEMKIYPHNKKGEEKIAFSANFYFDNNKLFCDSKQVEVYALPENHFYIKILPVRIGSSNFENYDKIESEQNKIKTLKILPTLTKKGEIEVYEINRDLPTLKEKYYVNLTGDKVNYNLEILKLIEFFENVRFGENEQIKENFSHSLSERLSVDNVVKFFGKFEDMRVVNFYDSPAIVLFYKNRNARVFSATFDRMLIDNVFEIE